MELFAELVRELGEGDERELVAEREVAGSPRRRLSQRHHALARALAAGMAPMEASAAFGYVPTTISILQGDPTFSELVKFYRQKEDAQSASLGEKLIQLAIEASDELLERIEEKPESFSKSELRDVIKMGADRTGFGPSSTSNQNLNVNINLADRLKAARDRVAAARVIDHEG